MTDRKPATTTRYAIRHLTRFAYAGAVSESVMELRMRPATDGGQRCLRFEVDVEPRARVFAYQDFLGNWIHHFDIPRRHAHLTIVARAQVEIDSPPVLPESLPVSSWSTIDQWVARADHWDARQPSRFAVWSEPLVAFAESLGDLRRHNDPLTAVRAVTTAVHRGFQYAPNSTRVDSPIDDALAARRGVCQDFSHILLAVLRRAELPCRYVSGYIAPSTIGDTGPTTIATHAWVEVCLPELGWVGVDPTHDTFAGTRHLRVAIGRDYADVPPTRGVFKGGPATALSVSVEVVPGESVPTLDPAVMATEVSLPFEVDERRDRAQHEQQQQ